MFMNNNILRQLLNCEVWVTDAKHKATEKQLERESHERVVDTGQ